MNSNVYLRELQEDDANKMLEWMHDADINQYFRFPAATMTKEEVLQFIYKSKQSALEKKEYHFAVADDRNEYLGTISLKDIDWNAKTGEYAISLRKIAQGKGIATKATKELLKFAFEELELNRIFLNVLSDNEKAIQLYQRCNFGYEGTFKNHLCINGKMKSLDWYAILRSEWEQEDGKDNA